MTSPDEEKETGIPGWRNSIDIWIHHETNDVFCSIFPEVSTSQKKKKKVAEPEKLNKVHILESLVSWINNLDFHTIKTGESSKDCEKKWIGEK